METSNLFGTEKIGKILLKLAPPVMLAQLIQALYNIVDSLFVGRCSDTGLTALSIVYPLQLLMIAIAVGTGVGINTVMAAKLGVGRRAEAEEYAGVGTPLAAALWLVFAISSWFLMPAYARLSTGSEAVISDVITYGRIVSVASFGLFLESVWTKILQADGDMRTPMIAQILGAVTNIVLDPVFIFALGMGVRGAALATVISQCLSCVWVLAFLRGKKTMLTLRAENLFPGAKLVLPCIALGAASFVMQASESVISVCFNSSLLKYGGDIAVGAMTILTSVMQLAMLPLQGIAQGAQPILSYNYGARSAGRVRSTFRLLLRVCLCYSITLWALVMLFPGLFAGMFSSDAALILFTKKALRIYCGALFMFGIQIACQMTFVSIGFAGCSIIVAVMRKFVLLLPLIYIMPQLIADKTAGVYTAEPVADIIAVCFTAVMFSVEFKKAMKALEDKGAEPA